MSDSLPLIVANLKANKTWNQISSWLDEVGPHSNSFSGTVIICPSPAFLASSNEKIKSVNFKIKLASQDISRFPEGAYTGELAASQIADFCQYTIIGHSERRQYFQENDQILTQKVQNAKEAGLEPIFCIQDSQTEIPEGIKIVAYEPVFAIGTGILDTPENARNVAKLVKQKGKFSVIYGGSVSNENTKEFIQKDIIDGVLVGTASLDPKSFIEIIKAAGSNY